MRAPLRSTWATPVLSGATSNGALGCESWPEESSSIDLGQTDTAVLVVQVDDEAVLACNAAACMLLQTPQSKLLGRRLTDLLTADLAPTPLVVDPARRRYWFAGCNGPISLLRVDAAGVHAGMPARLVHLIDMTMPDEANARARQELDFLQSVMQALPAAIFVKDMRDNGRYVLCSKTTEDMAHLPHNTVLGATDPEVFPPETAEAFVQADRQLLASREPVVSESTFYRDTGAVVVTETRKMLLQDGAGRDRYILGLTEDITQRREMEMRLARGAMVDPLTGLGNRTLFRERLRAALKRREELGGLVVLHSLDLDHFKGVNDTLGHAAGDRLLIEVAARIAALCGPVHTAARLGGDEFAIIQGPVASLDDAVDLANRLAASLAMPINIGARSLVIGASHGIAFAPDHGDDPDRLARSADFALYGAKEVGRGTYRFFDTDLATQIQERRTLEEELREALANEQFELFYQPIVDVRENRIVSFEALLRWNHPTRGLVLPSVIMPVAEESGIILPLGDWVMREACRQAASWTDPIGISVNVSSLQFRQPGLADSIRSALLASGLEPQRLEVEITETVLLTNNQHNLDTLHELRDLGIRISLDDFGTGYSSLGYLCAFPFHKIKIDRSFVGGMAKSSVSLAIIRSVIKLAMDLGMATTAEGVETWEQLDQLRNEGCAEAQGYYFERPQPSHILPAMLSTFADRRLDRV